MVGRGIALHSIVPVRSMASEAAEQQTQMLFAQTCDIIEEKSRWKRIKLHNDGQEGWADAKMISPLSEEEYVSVIVCSSAVSFTFLLTIVSFPAFTSTL